jgi:hypothetical protein
LDKAISVNEARSLMQLSEALRLARREYCRALVAHEDASFICSALDPGNPFSNEAIRKTNAQLEAASLQYAKALRDFRTFHR